MKNSFSAAAVAEALGVSINTVYRAINHSGLVKSTTAAPGTTAAPTQTPSNADVMPVICIALMLAAACLTLRKKFN